MNELRGLSHGRLGRRKLVIAFGVGLVIVIGITSAIAGVAAPSAFLCQPYKPCGPPRLVQPLVNLQLWRSPRYGFAVEYPGDQVSVQAQGSSAVVLGTASGNVVLIVAGSPPSQSPRAAISAVLSGLQSKLSGLASDSAPQEAVLGSNLGFVSGLGGPYVGTQASSSGVSQPSSVVVQSASNGKLTLTATVVANTTDFQTKHGTTSSPTTCSTRSSGHRRGDEPDHATS